VVVVAGCVVPHVVAVIVVDRVVTSHRGRCCRLCCC
jgi:hypothetical protein